MYISWGGGGASKMLPQGAKCLNAPLIRTCTYITRLLVGVSYGTGTWFY